MKTKETINNILKKVRKRIKPSKGPLTSIDPKKMERVADDVEVALEIAKSDKRSEKQDNEKKNDKK